MQESAGKAKVFINRQMLLKNKPALGNFLQGPASFPNALEQEGKWVTTAELERDDR